MSTTPDMEVIVASKDPRPSKANAKLDPRPSRANADADPRPTSKPDVSTGKQGDTPNERVEQSPTTDPGERTNDTEPAPRRAIADSLPPPDQSGPGEQHHLDPSQRAASNG